jgi:hypothetical protein
MAFTNPDNSVWCRASLINEVIDGINDRAVFSGSTGQAWYPLANAVANVTHVQRASYWNVLQGACVDLIEDGNWVVAHAEGALKGTDPDDAFDGTSPNTTIDTYSVIADVSAAMGVTLWRRRDDDTAWDAEGQTQVGSVLSNYVIEDLQTFLKALIWTKHTISWTDAPGGTGEGGNDIGNATKDGAMTAAIADYGSFGPDASDPTYDQYPHGIVGYALDGAVYDGWASRRKRKGQITLVTGSQCDIYWFGYPMRPSGNDDEWSDQDSGAASLTENTWKRWETEADVTPGASPRDSSTEFGDYDFANSPTDKPGTTNESQRRGWQCRDSGEDCAVIDWRDSITYHN